MSRSYPQIGAIRDKAVSEVHESLDRSQAD